MIPVAALLYISLFLVQVVWNLIAAMLEAVGAWLIGYLVYLLFGLTIQGAT